MFGPNANDRFPTAGFNPVPPVNRLAERVRHYFDQRPTRPAPSAEDIRVHAWLTERLAMLAYERFGLWPRLRRFFFGNRLVRWTRGW